MLALKAISVNNLQLTVIIVGSHLLRKTRFAGQHGRQSVHCLRNLKFCLKTQEVLIPHLILY